MSTENRRSFDFWKVCYINMCMCNFSYFALRGSNMDLGAQVFPSHLRVRRRGRASLFHLGGYSLSFLFSFPPAFWFLCIVLTCEKEGRRSQTWRRTATVNQARCSTRGTLNNTEKTTEKNSGKERDYQGGGLRTSSLAS